LERESNKTESPSPNSSKSTKKSSGGSNSPKASATPKEP
jgi:hypothetical protein